MCVFLYGTYEIFISFFLSSFHYFPLLPPTLPFTLSFFPLLHCTIDSCVIIVTLLCGYSNAKSHRKSYYTHPPTHVVVFLLLMERNDRVLIWYYCIIICIWITIQSIDALVDRHLYTCVHSTTHLPATYLCVCMGDGNYTKYQN